MSELRQKVVHVRIEKAHRGAPVSLDEFDNILGEEEFDGVPAEVRWGYGRTKNLGDFNSLRVDCGVTLPCAPGNVVETLHAAQDIVKAAIVEFVTKEKNGGGSKPSF